MWRVGHVELLSATMDFTSSGQGLLEVTKVVADGVELVNAVELVDWAADETQFLVCSACGFEGCEPGNWVSMRRSGSLIVILPVADYVWPEREEDKQEYGPPSYLRKRGVAYFERATYQSLALRHSAFPLFEQIRQLNMREATLLFHSDAPAQVLGPPPDVHPRREFIVGDAVEYLKRLSDLMNHQYKDDSAAMLRPLSPEDEPISIYLSASEFSEWKPLLVGAQDRLVVDSRFVIERS